MSTGGFKRRHNAAAAIRSGALGVVGLARAFALDPSLSNTWQTCGPDPIFSRFAKPPPGGVTAWFTMRVTEIGEDREGELSSDALTHSKHMSAETPHVS